MQRRRSASAVGRLVMGGGEGRVMDTMFAGDAQDSHHFVLSGTQVTGLVASVLI